MIRRLYDAYLDRLAADRGAPAFFKWFFLGLLLQLAFILPALPLLAVGILLESEAGQFAAEISFFMAFLAARVFLFALPCGAVAERKGLGLRRTWVVGGFVFGPFALGLAAAQSTKAPAAAS